MKQKMIRYEKAYLFSQQQASSCFLQLPLTRTPNLAVIPVIARLPERYRSVDISMDVWFTSKHIWWDMIVMDAQFTMIGRFSLGEGMRTHHVINLADLFTVRANVVWVAITSTNMIHLARV